MTDVSFLKHWLGYIKAPDSFTLPSKVSSNCMDLITSPCVPFHTLCISVTAESFQIRLSLQSFAPIFPLLHPAQYSTSFNENSAL